MKNEEELPLIGLLHSCDELRKLILEYPDLPLLVFAGEECNDGDSRYMSCSHVSARLGEVLNCQQIVNDEILFEDREDFEDALRELEEDSFDGSEAEFDQFIENKMMEYEPYWTPCIILYVDN